MNMAQYSNIAVAPLSDGRLQCWAIDGSGKLWSRWKTSTNPSASWTPWSQFQMPQSGNVVTVAGAPLSDGRLQIWAVDANGKLWSCWKTTPNSSASWTPWTTFQMPSGVAAVKAIAGAPLTDKRLQIFCVDNAHQPWSCWKTST